MLIILPPISWNRETDGLKEVEFVIWAQEFERSLLPDDTIFPHPGQVWEAIRDCEVNFEVCLFRAPPKFCKQRLPDGNEVVMQEFGPLLQWGKGLPICPWGKANISAGERLRVVSGLQFTSDCGPRPLRACLQPVRYRDLEELIVPEELRQATGYKGYRLHVPTARPKWCIQEQATYLNRDFRLVGDVV